MGSSTVVKNVMLFKRAILIFGVLSITFGKAKKQLEITQKTQTTPKQYPTDRKVGNTPKNILRVLKLGYISHYGKKKPHKVTTSCMEKELYIPYPI